MSTAEGRVLPPRWRDRRLAFGVILIAGCALAGSRVMAAADHRVAVWAVRHDLAAGALLTAADLDVRRIALDSGLERYLGADGTPPAGQRLARAVGSGEVIPVSALATTPAVGRRLVTVPVEPLHAPVGLSSGDRVEMWLTPRAAAGADSAAVPSRVLAGALVATVADETDAIGASAERAVVLDVSADEAARVVAAIRRGAVDLVRLPLAEP